MEVAPSFACTGRGVLCISHSRYQCGESVLLRLQGLRLVHTVFPVLLFASTVAAQPKEQHVTVPIFVTMN